LPWLCAETIQAARGKTAGGALELYRARNISLEPRFATPIRSFGPLSTQISNQSAVSSGALLEQAVYGLDR
jgi:hypothetical protein